MSSCPILALPDLSQPFVLDYDAFEDGIGVVLMHNRHPIAYESGKLRDNERVYFIYDKEMLAIMHVLTNFHKYLVGWKFVVRTDQNRSKYFLEHNDLNEC